MSQKNVNVNYTDTSINTLLKIATTKRGDTKINVYSIQLKANESPDQIIRIKNKYLALFPLENVDELFEPPYFKAITGIYLDKNKAEKKLKNLKKHFKSAFILKRQISIEKFEKNLNNDF
tara:strand:- start:118 stop:477 length:360 start_codon:yes stop_codon:yes gene_type:complete